MTNDKKWYALKVVSGKEKKVKAHIESEVIKHQLSDYVGQVLLPAERVLYVREGKKKVKDKNLFPGYIFIEAHLIGELPHIIKKIPDVAYFLSDKSKGDPLPLRKEEVNRMLGIVDEMSVLVEEVVQTFVSGESVRVIDGPFTDFLGTVKEVHSDKKRLSVSISVFGRAAPVELDFNQVEKV